MGRVGRNTRWCWWTEQGYPDRAGSSRNLHFICLCQVCLRSVRFTVCFSLWRAMNLLENCCNSVKWIWIWRYALISIFASFFLSCARSPAKRNLQGLRVRGEVSLRRWNHRPTELSGKAPDCTGATIPPRGLCLSRSLLTSETLLEVFNGEILWVLGSFYHRPLSDEYVLKAKTSVGNCLNLAAFSYLWKAFLPPPLWYALTTQKAPSLNDFLPCIHLTECKSGCPTRSSETDARGTQSHPFHKFKPLLDSDFHLARAGQFIADRIFWKGLTDSDSQVISDTYSVRAPEIASPTNTISLVSGVYLPVHLYIRGQVMKHRNDLLRASPPHQRFWGSFLRDFFFFPVTLLWSDPTVGIFSHHLPLFHQLSGCSVQPALLCPPLISACRKKLAGSLHYSKNTGVLYKLGR